jgi:hypothetical protein
MDLLVLLISWKNKNDFNILPEEIILLLIGLVNGIKIFYFVIQMKEMINMYVIVVQQ